MARSSRKSLPIRYGGALFFAGAAMFGRWALDPLLGTRSPYTFFFAAVAASAWLGGFGPGLLTLVIGGLFSYGQLVAPRAPVPPTFVSQLIGLAMFLSAGTLVALIGEAQRRARLIAEERTADLVALREVEREAERRKDESLGLVESLLGNAPIGLAFFDRSHRYVRINDDLAAINGRAVEDHLGRTLAEVVPVMAPVVDPILDRLFSGGEAVHDLEIQGETSASPGELRFWLCGFYAVRTTDGKIPWVGAVITEITGRKRDEAVLRDAMEAATAADRAKDQFLAMLSHELRTPLTPVLAEVSAMLDDDETPAELRPVLENVRRNIELESRLIDDLLDLTRIGQGKLPMSLDVVNAHVLMHRALEICHSELEAADLEIEIDLAAKSAFVDADSPRLQQVFWNLIKNSVKFTPRGGRISIRSRNEADGDRLVIEVADSGIGISAEVLPKIFDAFEQGGQSVTRKFGGLGLGLAISRSLVNMHGGQLLARSAGRDLGSTFSVELDTVAAPGPCDEAAADREGLDRRLLQILLVEDNPDTLQVMARLLRKSGHRVSTAMSVESALIAAEPGDFDVVVSDLGLPDGSGLDLMRQLGVRGSIPGVALSGFGSESDLRESLAAGFDIHLTKPVDFRSLERAIRLVTTPKNGASSD